MRQKRHAMTLSAQDKIQMQLLSEGGGNFDVVNIDFIATVAVTDV